LPLLAARSCLRLRFRFGLGLCGAFACIRDRIGGLHPAPLDLVDTLRTQDLLHAADGIALEVEQVPDAAQEIEVLRTIIPPPAAALHGPDLRELLLPEPKYVLGHLQLICNFADRPEGFG